MVMSPVAVSDIDAAASPKKLEVVKFVPTVCPALKTQDLPVSVPEALLPAITIDSLFLSDELLFQWTGVDFNGNTLDLGLQVNNEDLINLVPGVYTYTIDNGICIQQGFEIVNPGQDLEFITQEPYYFDSPFNQYSVQCFGDTAAEMYLEFIGGQPPYDLYVSVNGILGPVAYDITNGQSIDEPFSYIYNGFLIFGMGLMMISQLFLQQAVINSPFRLRMDNVVLLVMFLNLMSRVY